jgi:hypothetical protein
MTIVFIYPMNFDIIGNTVFINNQEIPVSKHRISNLKTKLTYILGDVLC